jgi:hypothetical protein
VYFTKVEEQDAREQLCGPGKEGQNRGSDDLQSSLPHAMHNFSVAANSTLKIEAEGFPERMVLNYTASQNTERP